METGTIVLFDWGNTLMRDFPGQTGPMYRWPVVSLCPGADRMLSRVSARYPCYLVTNAVDSTREEIHLALNRGGIGRYMSGIFCFREVGYKKPSDAFFNHIVTALDCEPEMLVMIGDHPLNDCDWAIRHGGHAILYDPDGQYGDTGYRTVRSLDEIPEMLDGKWG